MFSACGTKLEINLKTRHRLKVGIKTPSLTIHEVGMKGMNV